MAKTKFSGKGCGAVKLAPICAVQDKVNMDKGCYSYSCSEVRQPDPLFLNRF